MAWSRNPTDTRQSSPFTKMRLLGMAICVCIKPAFELAPFQHHYSSCGWWILLVGILWSNFRLRCPGLTDSWSTPIIKNVDYGRCSYRMSLILLSLNARGRWNKAYMYFYTLAYMMSQIRLRNLFLGLWVTQCPFRCRTTDGLSSIGDGRFVYLRKKHA